MQSSPVVRRPKFAISTYSFNIFHVRNPLVVAWWSLVYPGFGHLRLVMVPKGVFLFVGELLLNVHCHLNLAILYSFTGRFTQAKEVLNTRMLLLYSAILVFAMWDSYRGAVEINKLSVLGDHENDKMVPTVITPAGLSSMDKRNPWVAVAWSMLMPGLGHLYCLAMVVAVFMIAGGALLTYMSNVIPAIMYTATGNFALAKSVIDWQWFVNLPSFYGFAIYDAYVKTVETNKIFEQEQVQFLKNNYQSSSFKFPVKKEGNECMS